MQEQIDKISTKILNTGIASIPEFLSTKEVQKIKKFVGKPKKGSGEGIYPTTLKQFMIKILKLEFKKLANTFFTRYC